MGAEGIGQVRQSQRTSRFGGAFTIIEVIVVVILIGLLATLVAPRLTGNADRGAQIEAEGVRQFLSTVGQRTVLSTEPVAILWDAANNEFSLLIRPRSDTLGFGPLGDPKKAASSSSTNKEIDAWKPAPLVPPMRLSASSLAAILIDGQPISLPQPSATDPWRYELHPGAVRSVISIVLKRPITFAGGESPGYQIDLLPGRTVARMQDLAAVGAPKAPDDRSVDLDQRGRDSAW